MKKYVLSIEAALPYDNERHKEKRQLYFSTLNNLLNQISLSPTIFNDNILLFDDFEQVKEFQKYIRGRLKIDENFFKGWNLYEEDIRVIEIEFNEIKL